MKRIGLTIAAIVSMLSLTACADTAPTVSRDYVGTGRTAGYVLVTDWTRVPSQNDQATDIWVRIIKIENVCYAQTNSVHDWAYSLVPTGVSC